MVGEYWDMKPWTSVEIEPSNERYNFWLDDFSIVRISVLERGENQLWFAPTICYEQKCLEPVEWLPWILYIIYDHYTFCTNNMANRTLTLHVWCHPYKWYMRYLGFNPNMCLHSPNGLAAQRDHCQHWSSMWEVSNPIIQINATSRI